MSDKYECRTNSLCRFLVSRNYFYLYRNRIEGKYIAVFNKSPLLDELLMLYKKLKEDGSPEVNTYVKKNKQKAE